MLCQVEQDGRDDASRATADQVNRVLGQERAACFTKRLIDKRQAKALIAVPTYFIHRWVPQGFIDKVIRNIGGRSRSLKINNFNQDFWALARQGFGEPAHQSTCRVLSSIGFIAHQPTTACGSNQEWLIRQSLQ